MSITKPLGELTTQHMPIRLHIATQILAGARVAMSTEYVLRQADALLECYAAKGEQVDEAMEALEGNEEIQEMLLQSSIVDKWQQGNTTYTPRERAYMEDNPGWWARIQDGEIV